jgi:hypothetical protein
VSYLITRRQYMCNHFWKIEPQDGPTSTGYCKFCGEIKQFSNSTETLDERKKARRVCGMRNRFTENACEPKSDLPVPMGLTGVVSMGFFSSKGQRS